MSTLEKAIEIAARAHAGQKQKNGQPFVLHPLHMMFHVQSAEEQITAVLHDVVEDTGATFEEIERAGFPAAIIEALRLLTRTEGQTYQTYIEQIKANPLARQVKLADLRHNIDVLRIPHLEDKDLERCRKYHRAIRDLEAGG